MSARQQPGSQGGPKSWRAGQASSRDSDAQVPEWKKKRQRASGGARVGYKLKVVVLLVFVLALIGALYQLLRPSDKTPLVALVATRYAFPIPPNSWAYEDVQALDDEDQMKGFDVEVLNVENLRESESPAAGMAQFVRENVKTRFWLFELFGRRPAVVYVTMHGVVDENANPCLLPPWADPLDSGQWIRVDTFIDELNNQLGGREILLVLDCNRLKDQWGLGLLGNGFAEGLEAWAKENADRIPNLAILTSTGPGQVAYTSPVAGRSAFGFCVQAALMGVADRQNGADRDDWVSLQELAGSVSGNVESWVNRYRGDRQRPMLLPEGRDFEICVATDIDPRKAREAIRRGPSNDVVEKLWEVPAQWSKDDSARPNNAVEHHAYLARLIWLEQVNRAGAGDERGLYPKLAEEASAELARLANGFQIAARVGMPVTNSADHLWQLLVAARRDDDPIAKEIHDVHLKLHRLWTQARPRALGLVGPQFEQVNEHRRSAEDWVFVETQDALLRAGQLQDSARNELIRAQKARNQAHFALATVRRAGSEIPYLLLWDVRKRTTSTSENDSRETLHTLAAQLENPDSGNIRFDELESSAATINGWLAHQRDSFVREVDELTRHSADESLQNATLLNRVSVVLSVPLLLGDNRTLLRNVELKTLERFDADFEREVLSAGTPQSDGDEETVFDDDAIAGAGQDSSEPHPALALVAPQSVAEYLAEAKTLSAPRLRLASQGEKIRRTLRRVQKMDWRKEFDESLDRSGPPGTVVELRGRLRDPALALRRSAAWLVVDTGNLRDLTEPLRHLETLDQHRALLWHADRVLEDFYGNGVPNDPDPFFAKAAAAYLRLAKQQFQLGDEPTNPDKQLARLLREERARREEKRETHLIAAENWIRLDPKAIHLADLLPEQETVDHETRVDHYEKGFPPGTAAFYLESTTQGRPSTRSNQTSIPIGGTATRERTIPARIEVSTFDDPRDESRLEAVAFYRGHLKPTFVTPSQNDFELVSLRQPKQTATVTVRGDSRLANLMFVFDCSGSMSDPLGARQDGKLRINEARAAVKEVLEELVENRNNTNIGLRVYGHRVGFPQRRTPPLPARQQWAVRRRTDIDNKVLKLRRHRVPWEVWRQEVARTERMIDLDRVLEFEPLSIDLYDEICLLLDDLEPLGATPLYYSLVTAVAEDFPDVSQGAINRIVLLTDGDDAQRRDVETGWSGPFTDFDDARRAFESMPSVQLDVVGIGLDPSATRVDDLARRTQGEYFPAQSSEELKNGLRRLLITTGRLRSDDGRTSGQEPLGKPVTVRGLPGRHELGAELQVEAIGGGVDANTAITLAGGEALELRVRDRQTLVHDRYRAGFDEEMGRILRPDGSDANYVVRIHDPPLKSEDTSSTLIRQISFADDNEYLFTQHPAEVWIEFRREVTQAERQRLSGIREIRYPFFDLPYDNDMPSPVVTCRVPQWPGTVSGTAEVWFKFKPTQPTGMVPLASVDVGSDFESDALPGITFSWSLPGARRRDIGSEIVVRIKEMHRDGAGEPDWLKVDLVAPGGAADPRWTRSEHGYDLANGIATHHFHFDRIGAAEVRKLELRLTESRAVKASAYRLREAHEVGPRRSETIPAGGGRAAQR